jgi:PAS domain S-box-containing protein
MATEATDRIALLGLSLYKSPQEIPARPFSPATRKSVAELVLETTSEGVWLIDEESRTTFVNRHTARILGYDEHAMVGMHLFDFMDDEGRKICERNLERRRNGIEEHHDFKFMRSDGRAVWTTLATNPVYDREGRYAGALAMVSDVTEKKYAELAQGERVRSLESLLAANAEEVADLRRRVAALKDEAYRDVLTGLYNRRYMMDRLSDEISRAQRYRTRFCLLYLDLDHFKIVNDTHGHGVGDAVLASVGRLLRPHAPPDGAGGESGEATRALRASDVAARFGGDEFVIFAPSTTLEGGMNLADRLVSLCLEAGRELPQRPLVRASVGVAAFPYHASTPAALLAAADGGLLEAKRQGRGRACMAPGMA